jgi:hypothetical protein
MFQTSVPVKSSKNRNVPVLLLFHRFYDRNRKTETLRNRHKHDIIRPCSSSVPLSSYRYEKDREIATYTLYTPIYKYIGNFRDTGTPVLKETLMNEKLIERKLKEMVRQSGGLALKFTSPGFDGVPDRLILMPGGKAYFAELKTTGKRPRPLQMRRKRQLEALGFKVFIIDSPEQMGGVLDEIRSS